MPVFMTPLRSLSTLARLSVLIGVMALSGCGEPPPSPRPESAGDLVGAWRAEMTHGGQTGSFALELEPDGEGGVSAFLSLPDIDAWRIPAGSAQFEAGKVRIGSMVLRHDAESGALTGTMPATLVPVHSIPLELHRVARLDRPAPTEIAWTEAEPLWSHDTGAAIWAGVESTGGTIYVGNDDGSVRALDAASGELLWEFKTEGAIRARPTRSGESLLVHSDDGRLYRLDASSGTVTWRATLGEPSIRLGPGDERFRYDHYASAPVVGGATVFVGHADRLIALDAATGEEIWSFQAEDIVTSTPAVSDRGVFFASFDGHVYALDAAKGALLWKHDTGAEVPSSPALHDALVIVGSRSYDLFGLRASDGTPAWSFYTWYSWVESDANVVDGVAYVGSSDAQLLRAVDASNGQPLWSFDTGGSAWARPAVSRDKVFIGTVGVAGYSVDHRGAFLAVDRTSGKPLWRFKSERPGEDVMWGFGSSPATGTRTVFVGGLDGVIRAFRD